MFQSIRRRIRNRRSQHQYQPKRMITESCSDHTALNSARDKYEQAMISKDQSGPEKQTDKQVTVVIVGAGMRGSAYAAFAQDFSDRMKVVAVAEPLEQNRHRLQKIHGIPDGQAFDDWSDLASRDKMADCAIIATQDRMHKDPAVAFAAKGYAILLEKPMSVDREECQAIYDACHANDVMLAVCHPLRYFPPYAKIRELIEDGHIGDVMHIQHTEHVGYWHFAHSYVRGNWRNTAESSFSLLAKCCHDLDLLVYWMGRKKCTAVQSFGSLAHFKASNKPEGAADRCLQCPVEQNCVFSVQKLYLKDYSRKPALKPHWPATVVCDIEDTPDNYLIALTEALEKGPYGRCVYACDNDVCDNQTVNLEFEGGVTATHTLNAFSEKSLRITRIYGSKGEIWMDYPGPVYHRDFLTNTTRKVPVAQVPILTRVRGHAGADYFLMDAFIKAVATGDPSYVASGPEESLRSHLLVFDAEKSRLEKRIISVLTEGWSWVVCTDHFYIQAHR